MIVCDEWQTRAGWWYTYPYEKYEFVSWDDYSTPMKNDGVRQLGWFSIPNMMGKS